jgi:hypothetical protein
MPFDATPGGPASTSYLTVADADAIAASQGLGEASTAWLAAPEGDKEKALTRATSEIDAYVVTGGAAGVAGQALIFPRSIDYDGAGDYFIHRNVELATYWQAVHVLANADQLDRANARRARGLISFSDDDGGGSVVSVKPEFGQLSSQALTYLRPMVGVGRASLRSVAVQSSYGRGRVVS